MITECQICHQELQEGDKVVRVETVLISEHGTFGTTGWTTENQQFVCLDCLTPPLEGVGR